MRARVSVLVLVCLGVLTSSAHADYTPRVLPESLGMNAQFLSSPPGPSQPSIIGNSAKLNKHLTKLAESGVDVLRVSAAWEYVEPNAPLFGHDYKWTREPPYHPYRSMDARIAALANHGIRAVPILLGAPPWAKGGLTDPHVAPFGDSDWAAFAAAFAARYSNENSDFWGPWKSAHQGMPAPVVQTYEIWNEPNLPGRFKPYGVQMVCNENTAPASQPGPARYGQLFRAAYNAIKSVDLNATVMVGGLESRQLHDDQVDPSKNYEGECTVQEFLIGAKANMGTITPDAIGLHVYLTNATSAPPAPIATAADRIAKTVSVRADIDALGWTQPLPIYLNETGWGENPSTIGQPDHDVWRGEALAEMTDVLLRSNCRIRQVVPHTWLTSDTAIIDDDGEDRLGLAVDDDELTATVKPGGLGYLNQVRTLKGKGASAPDPDPEDLCAWRGPADIDEDGYLDGAGTEPDQYPGDPDAH